MAERYSYEEAMSIERVSFGKAMHHLRYDELFVMLKPLKNLVDVIHWFQTAAKAKLHN